MAAEAVCLQHKLVHVCCKDCCCRWTAPCPAAHAAREDVMPHKKVLVVNSQPCVQLLLL
jgi:hypothetical protein